MSPEMAGGPEKKGGGAAKWIIGGCLILVLVGGGCFVGCFFLAQGMVTGNPAYKAALDKLQKHSEVTEKLGSPIKPGFGGSAKVNVTAGTASATFPIKGPKGSGTVAVTASKTGNTWTITSLTVTLDTTKEVITIVKPEDVPKK
jgi:hypothetical protein